MLCGIQTQKTTRLLYNFESDVTNVELMLTQDNHALTGLGGHWSGFFSGGPGRLHWRGQNSKGLVDFDGDRPPGSVNFRH